MRVSLRVLNVEKPWQKKAYRSIVVVVILHCGFFYASQFVLNIVSQSSIETEVEYILRLKL